MMTKTDFVAIEEAIRDARLASAPKSYKLAETRQEQEDLILAASNHSRVWDSFSRTIADVCAKQNPRFQRSKFLAQCGVEGVNPSIKKP